MGILISLFQSLVSIADAIVYGVLYFFAIIIITLAFASAGPDDYWAEGGMPLSTETKAQSID
ncbi:hypothetical protein N8269_05000 [Candidatus Thioglobus sp.]|nr:hypothetical protein [Candidatus Thioglobus sp.]